MKPTPDVDDDGIGDIVGAFRGTPSFLAISGKDGSMLWTYTADVRAGRLLRNSHPVMAGPISSCCAATS